MKALYESLFDTNLSEKNLLDDSEFKAWINRPDTLWYFYFYWADDMEDPFQDFMGDEWEKYKSRVDYILDCVGKRAKKLPYKGKSMYGHMLKFTYDDYEWEPEEFTSFEDDEDYTACLSDAMWEIKHKSTQEEDGIWKTWFKGQLPKNSNVTELINRVWEGYELPIDGGIFLTNEDSVIVISFPHGVDKDILKLFNIR